MPMSVNNLLTAWGCARKSNPLSVAVVGHGGEPIRCRCAVRALQLSRKHLPAPYLGHVVTKSDGLGISFLTEGYDGGIKCLYDTPVVGPPSH
jgi:hypothetical protein